MMIVGSVSNRFGGLWRNPDFVKLWAGQTIAMFGGQITGVMLPLTATLYLDATPKQMGLLTAAGSAPFLVFSLLAGVWVDRRLRRPILIAANIGRAVLLALIPVLFLTKMLRIEHLITISFFVGTLTMFFQLAYQSYLPTLLEHAQLVEGNSKLATSGSLAEIGGPGLAGVLVQLFSAPFALLLTTGSFVVAAISMLLIGRTEHAPPPAAGDRSIKREIKEGMQVTFGDRILRAGACSAASYNFSWNMIEAVLVLYLIRDLGMNPGLFGLALAVGSVGTLLGSLLTASIARRCGAGPTIIGSAALSCTVLLVIPVITGPILGAGLLAGTFFVRGVGLVGWNIQIESLQQAMVPGRLLGRMNSSYLLLSLGTGVVGALLGGYLGEGIGLRPTLIVGALGISLAWLWLFFSPLRSLRELPQGSAS